MTLKKKTGFALMSEAKLRETTSKGGRNSQRSRRGHRFSEDERRGGNLRKGRFYEFLAQPLKTPAKRRLVTVIEAADLLGIHLNTARKWIRERLLVSVSPSHCWSMMVTLKSIRRLRSRFRKKYRVYLRKRRYP